jgi:uncharacterized linocin/CFP29 family protein
MAPNKKTISGDVAPYGLTHSQWQKIQKAARKINADTAIVESRTVYVWDPYEVNTNRPRERQLTGRVPFVCSPDSDVWVYAADLPKPTRVALCRRKKRAAQRRRKRRLFYSL